MSRFRAVFGDKVAVLPIIHVVGREQALRNAETARAGGADGAFLICHGAVCDNTLLDILAEVQESQPGFWLGINCLSMRPEEVYARVPPGTGGVWSDEAGIEESSESQPIAARIAAARQEHPALFFGGVAFKYQRPVRDPAAAAAKAAPWMDVVTTSGPGTGQAAPPAKVRAMKQAIGAHPLALASGVTPENANDYLAWADAFLVSTGISYDFEELDPARLRDLVRVVRDAGPRC